MDLFTLWHQQPGRRHRAALAGLLVGWALALSLPAALPVAAATPGVAAAAGPAALVAGLASSADPAAGFSRLSPADRQSVVGYLSVARFGSSEVRTRRSGPPVARTIVRSLASGAGCWTWRWERDAYNLFGLKLWAYIQEIDWCDDGLTMVGPPQLLNYGTVAFPFWTWTHAADHVWGGAGQTSFRSWTQADFSLCLTPNLGCIQNTYPWLDMTAHANGTAGGSIG
jgi:hypothetical protein